MEYLEPLKGITTWPYTVRGRLELVDAGSSGDSSPGEFMQQWWGSGHFKAAEGPDFGFSITGSVLLDSGISIEELDDGREFLACVEIDESSSAVAYIGGKEYRVRNYVVTQLERAK